MNADKTAGGQGIENAKTRKGESAKKRRMGRGKSGEQRRFRVPFFRVFVFSRFRVLNRRHGYYLLLIGVHLGSSAVPKPVGGSKLKEEESDA